MTAMPQRPFDEDDFFLNSEPRVPAVFVVDRSGSMADRGKLDQLNRGLQVLAEKISADEMALKRVDAAIVSFGPTRVEQPFATLDRFAMPHLTVGGGTPMGEAVLQAIQLIDDRKAEYKANGLPRCYTPWLWLITDGEPTDAWMAAAKKLKSLDATGSLMAFAVGVDGADMNCLANFSNRAALKLKETRFEEMFDFVSHALSSVAHSRPGDRVSMPNPEAQGWGEFAA